MRLNTLSLVAALLAALMIGEAGTAQAQCGTPSETCVNVGADGKGILGGGILGAEIGFMIPALIVYAGARELDEWWSWVLFPALGAAGGAVLGYFALEDPTTMTDTGAIQQGFPEAAVAVLAVSIALIVPTFVGVLSLTSYSPSGDGGGQGASGDEDAAGDEASEQPAQENSAEQARRDAMERTMAGGPGFVRFNDGELLLGVPMAYATDSFTAEERAHMRLTGMVDYRIPVVSGAF